MGWAVAFLKFSKRHEFAARLAPNACLLALILAASTVQAADLRLKIPKRTQPTPVQRLNQEGVNALAKNDTTRAKRAIYKAYLLDPDDPFTLNNLGYVAELDGEIGKAQKFYDLAAANGSDATVQFSSNPELKGKQVSQVAGNAVSAPMQVNRLNVAAMGLVMKDRAPEAEITLRKALALDPRNPFTLNNIGFALEMEGELEQAMHFYGLAAESGSKEKIVVAASRSWRGHSIADIASLNAKAARRELSAEGSAEAMVARFNLRGVSAINRNQFDQARQYFQQAYDLDPSNAFSLNNRGYISESEGDRETADFYYAKAREANHSGARVALATRRNFQGMKLASVADQNERKVEDAQDKQLAALHAQGFPPLPLRTRDQVAVREPASPPRPEPEIPIRILAEDNPPPEQPAVMASSAQSSLPVQHSNTRSAQDTQWNSTSVTPRPTRSQAPTTALPEPLSEAPLLPIIPDEVPAGTR
jgi:Flp pilus assembly protein TadD